MGSESTKVASFTSREDAIKWVKLMEAGGQKLEITNVRSHNAPVNGGGKIRKRLTETFDFAIEALEARKKRIEKKSGVGENDDDLKLKEESARKSLKPTREKIHVAEKEIDRLQRQVIKHKKSQKSQLENIDFFEREIKKRQHARLSTIGDLKEINDLIKDTTESFDKAMEKVPTFIIHSLQKQMLHGLETYAKRDGKVPLSVPYQIHKPTNKIYIFSPFTEGVFTSFAEGKADEVQSVFAAWLWCVTSALNPLVGEMSLIYNNEYLTVVAPVPMVGTAAKILAKGNCLIVGAESRDVPEGIADKLVELSKKIKNGEDIPTDVNYKGVFTFTELGDVVWEEIKNHFI